MAPISENTFASLISSIRERKCIEVHGKEQRLNSNLPRDNRLDFIKALAIVLVLFWHLQPIKVLITDKSNSFWRIIDYVLMLLNNQITLIAVPLFIFVSLYLFYQKYENSTVDYLNKQWRRVAGLYLFWTGCQFLCFYGLSAIGIRSSNISIPAIAALRLLMVGGPSLPIVQDSVFYFFFVLLLLMPLSLIYCRLRNKGKFFSFIGYGIVIISLIYFEIINLTGAALPYWRIDNFFIYIPLSHFILKCNTEKLRSYNYIFLSCFIVFSIQDIFLLQVGYPLGYYSRVSIVFGSTLLFSFFLQFRSLGKCNIVSFLSKYTLGIFALHKYFQLIIILLLLRYGLAGQLQKMSGPVDLTNLIITLITMIITSATVYWASRTRIKRFLE